MFNLIQDSCKLKSILSKLLLLFLAPPTFSQNTILASVQNRLEAYNKNVFQEKIYVHTDKSFYIAGEIVWLKIYLVDGQSLKPASLSKVGYVEVLDNDNKPVAQAKIALNNGEGNGTFHLSNALSSGYYKLRAYTNWLKNFGPKFFFEKQITIVNPIRKIPAPAIHKPLQYSIDFFPEGGNLVQGIKSRVAFKLADQYRRGIDGKGVVLNENNDTVAAFEAVKFGTGSFDFLPLAGHDYKAFVHLADGTTLTTTLPKANLDGYAMNVGYMDGQQLIISVNTNNKASHEIHLVAQARHLVHAAQSSVVKDGLALFSIDKNKLGEGVNQITIFNSNAQVVCERLYFKRPTQNLVLNATADQRIYSSRQKVRLSFALKEPDRFVPPANLSLAVYKVDGIQTPVEANLLSYVYLSSDLDEWIDSPSYYFTDNGVETDLAMDNLMLTQSRRRLQWSSMLSDSLVPHKFPIEYGGQLITAKIIDARTGEPAKNIQAYLSIPGSALKLFTTVTDSAGLATFDVKDHYGLGEVVVQTNSELDSLYQISILNPYAETYSDHLLPPFSLSTNYVDSLLEDYSIAMQVQNIYAADQTRQVQAVQLKDSFAFFGQLGHSYVLDDYQRFTTMEEVLREYVREINVGVRNGRLLLKLFNEDRKEFFENNILLLLNGIPLRDVNKIFTYDPVKFKTLDVIPRPYVLGASSFMGLVNFSTYVAGLQDLELDQHLLVVDHDGLQLQRRFYAPVYETAEQYESRMPDFRNTLYWKPEVSVASDKPAELNFFTCDQKGNYVIEYQGMDADGRIISGRQNFSVQ